ncbi:MAG: hypothetical protein JZU63_10245, partial [Rhodoferax sp.]|nr:hypothetical protein [Rhodoferax sp.]
MSENGGIAIQTGLRDKRGRMSWTLKRHRDGTKEVKTFTKRSDAVAHVRKHVFDANVRQQPPNAPPRQW